MGEGKVREIQSLRNVKILSPQLLEQKKKSVGSYVVEPHYSPPESTGQINTEGQASSRNHQRWMTGGNDQKAPCYSAPSHCVLRQEDKV